MANTWTTPGGEYYEIYKDMLEQAHLLVAGSPGSGKSVCINGLIATALLSAPCDAEGGKQFIIIDPKNVDMMEYENLPHTIRYADATKGMGDIISALQYAVKIMDNRTKEMKRDRQKKYIGGDLFVIIDEFSDLMDNAKKECLPLVKRLAQLGRAERVHVILASQQVLAKTLPTEIRCCFTAKVGLHTTNAGESRLIINQGGCEKLPRHGETLYLTPEGLEHYCVPMVEPDVIESRIKHWEAQATKNKVPKRKEKREGSSFWVAALAVCLTIFGK